MSLAAAHSDPRCEIKTKTIYHDELDTLVVCQHVWLCPMETGEEGGAVVINGDHSGVNVVVEEDFVVVCYESFFRMALALILVCGGGGVCAQGFCSGFVGDVEEWGNGRSDAF